MGLEVQLDILRPAGRAATCAVMRHTHRTRRFPRHAVIETFSSFYFMQGSNLFLHFIACEPVVVEYRILCIHDFASLDYGERLSHLPNLLGAKVPEPSLVLLWIDAS